MNVQVSFRTWSTRIGVTFALLAAGGAAGLLIRARSADVPIGALASSLLGRSPPQRPAPIRRAGTAPSASCDVPVFTTGHDVETDSTKPSYDPAALLYLGTDVQEIFRKERRNEHWASTLESSMGHQMLADVAVMVPQIRDAQVECRSRSCKVTWATGAAEDDQRIEHALALGAPASQASRFQESGGRSGIMYLYRPLAFLKTQYGEGASHFDATDPEAYAKAYRERRAMLLSQIHAGTRKLPPIMANAPLPAR